MTQLRGSVVEVAQEVLAWKAQDAVRSTRRPVPARGEAHDLEPGVANLVTSMCAGRLRRKPHRPPTRAAPAGWWT